MKTCSRCKEEKELSEFYINKQSKGGFRKECKICKNKVQKNWELKNKENRIEYYNPKNQQLAIVSKRIQDSVYYTPASIVEDKIEKIVKSNLTKKLLGYELTAQEIHTKWDTKTFFYSPLALKTNSTFWRNHKYNYLSEMTAIAMAFPMIIHHQSLLGNWILAVSKIEPMKLDDTVFNITSSK